MEAVEKNVGVATVYSYRFNPGWAIFTINDNTGEFQITSDWGNWSYRWNVKHLGRPTLTDFLTTTDAHYVADKLSYGRGGRQGIQEFDAKKTREALMTGLHDLCLAADIEEDVKELIDDFFDEFDSNGIDSAYASTGLHEHMPDLHEYFRYSDKPEFVKLYKELLPFFLEQLRGTKR